MSEASSGRLMLELVLGATAIGGLIFGFHWQFQAKQQPSLDDTLVLKLYDKLERQDAKIIELLGRIQELEAKSTE